eukprot:2517356-Amphidinium_carterae.1
MALTDFSQRLLSKTQFIALLSCYIHTDLIMGGGALSLTLQDRARAARVALLIGSRSSLLGVEPHHHSWAESHPRRAPPSLHWLQPLLSARPL